MTQLTNYAENKILDFMRGQGLSLPTNWHIAIGSAGSDTGITEITGIGWGRISTPRSLAKWAGTQGAGTTLASSGTSHASSNNDAINFGTPTGSATASHVGFFDASTGGNCWFWFPIDEIDITAGDPDPVEIAAGALAFSFGITGGMSDYLSNKLIDLLWRAQAFSWPATVYLAYFTAAPTNAGGGTEVSGGAYARVSLVPSLASLSQTDVPGGTSASSGTGGRISNNAALTWPAPTADQGTIVAEGIYDASTTGNLLWWHAITAKSVLSGGPAPSHAANTLGITLD